MPSTFDQLKVLVQGKINILIITETKLDSNFSLEQFVISGYSKPFRLDRKVEEVLLYIREDISSKELRFFNMPENLEIILVEINLIKAKWLICGCYRLPSPVFLTCASIRQMPTWLPTWKAKLLYHVSTFLSTWFFLPLQKFTTIKIKLEKNLYTQANMCLLHISRNFKDIFKYVCFILYL